MTKDAIEDDSFLNRKQSGRKKMTPLVEVEPDWRKVWWNMPEYSMRDAMPVKQVVMSFLTMEDYEQFQEDLKVHLTPKSKSCWYPQDADKLDGVYYWGGEKVQPRYPIYIPSKGRATIGTTRKILDGYEVPYKLVIEPKEYKAYKRAVGKDKLLVLPDSDLGQGSIPARNFIWQHAIDSGSEKHWCIDDNILRFVRCHMNRRLAIKSAAPLVATEDMADRYDNVAFAGPHCAAFMRDRLASPSPFLLNSRVYSCILIRNDLPYRWRGKYNEDTDLCLRALKDGWCTILMRSLLMQKAGTAFSKQGGMAGGNTDTVYAGDDNRLAFAESLKEQHPDCVEVIWRYNRWHHLVDYSKFKSNKLILKDGITPSKHINNYGMILKKKEENDDEN